MADNILKKLFLKENQDNAIVDDATGDAFLPDTKYSKMFPIPVEIKQINQNYLLNNIESENELCYTKLISLCENYFPYPKLMQMGRVGNKESNDITLNNSLFFVCIGTKKAYDKELKTPINQRETNPLSLLVRSEKKSQTLFVNFLRNFFKNDESDYLNKTYSRNDIITVALFYREVNKSKKNSGDNVITDHLIAVASYVTDLQPSCLLSWLGVVNKFPCKKPHGINSKDLDRIQGKFKIGSFLICTCQWLVSLKKNRWVPILCQVYEKSSGQFKLCWYSRKNDANC